MPQTQCPKCGRTNPPEAGYCVVCGARLPRHTAGVNVCQECGYTGDPPGAKFCTSCGAKLSSPTADFSPTSPTFNPTMPVQTTSGSLLPGTKAMPSEKSSLARVVFVAVGMLGTVVVFGLIAGALWLAGLLPGPGSVIPDDPPKTPHIATPPPKFSTPTVTPQPDETPASTVEPNEGITAIPPTVTPTSEPSATPLPTLRWEDIGTSVQQRQISVAAFEHGGATALITVGSIQGDQTNTRDLLQRLISDYAADPSLVPENVDLYIIPSLNPDGNASGTRRNANNVDLNRNWDTFDWKPNAEQPGGVVRGSGGAYPHSEPETRHLASYIAALQNRYSSVRLVLWHSSQTFQSGGQVYPSGDEHSWNATSLAMANIYADIARYAVKSDWASYSTSGELVVWCAEEGVPAIDVVIPSSTSGGDSSLRSITMTAFVEITR